MAFCENCGTQLSDAAKFCRSCGKTAGTGGASPVSTPSKRRGPNTKLNGGARTTFLRCSDLYRIGRPRCLENPRPIGRNTH
jgi:hypothetical protein